MPRRSSLCALALAAALFLGCTGPADPVGAHPPDDARATAPATTSAAGEHTRAGKDPRRTRGLFVDPLMPAANQERVYRDKIGRYAQAMWIIPEAYPTRADPQQPWLVPVQKAVRAYTDRAAAAKKTPMLVVYGIPGRDCGQYSSDGALKNAQQYRAWINRLAAGVAGQKALVIIEPDALPFFSSPAVDCPTAIAGWQRMLRFASKRLGRTDAWAYLDAGHSNWTPYDARPRFLKQAGIAHVRGFSTNVSNFRTTAAEKVYAAELLRGLKRVGVRGKRYVIDTSRNGRAGGPLDGQVINPPWARLGAKPRLVFRGAFDGTVWVKHPGESDGTECGGPGSGEWSDLLADRLLGRAQPTC